MAANAHPDPTTKPRETPSLMVPLFAAVGAIAVVAVASAAVVFALAGSPSERSEAVTVVPAALKLYVAPGWKPGPGGQKYDAYSQTNFRVNVGQAVRLTITNRDDVPHSITSSEAGVNILVKPGTHTYSLIVYKAGTFEWHCAYPCDPYSMNTPGYMRGFITSTYST